MLFCVPQGYLQKHSPPMSHTTAALFTIILKPRAPRSVYLGLLNCSTLSGYEFQGSTKTEHFNAIETHSSFKSKLDISDSKTGTERNLSVILLNTEELQHRDKQEMHATHNRKPLFD